MGPSAYMLPNTCFRFLVFAFSMVILGPSLFSRHKSLAVEVRDTFLLGTSLAGNQTIISKNGTFVLGFFSPNGTNKWYIGIWFAQISEKKVVWVANRDTPIRDTPGALNFSRDGHLRLFDLQRRSVWSSDNSLKASRALMLDSGNFIMLGPGAYNSREVVWESFDHPGDTLLPSMKMWKGMKLTSWKSFVDPAPGLFSLGMNPSPGKTEFLLLYNNSVVYLTSGEWAGDHFTNLPETMGTLFYQMAFVKISPSKMYFTYRVEPRIQIKKPLIVLHQSGEVRNIHWNDRSFELIWSLPRDQCLVYGLCGKYGSCNKNNIQFCSCLKEFKPKDSSLWESQEWWSSGCVRRNPLQCSPTNGTTDGFMEVSHKYLPYEGQVAKAETMQGCRTVCLNNCSCSAFAIIDSTCRLWFGDLLNLQDSSDGQPLFIRLASSDLKPESSSKSRNPALVIVIPACSALVLALGLVMLTLVFRRNRRRRLNRGADDEPNLLRTFTYRELQIATKNFRHKLGKGAFGSVFKGTLPDDTVVAVKKLQGSGQTEKQFHAEISTVGNIQHVNLVRLRGFCTNGSRRLLVYEYMPNGSLDSLLFSKSEEEDKVLQWKTRFKIAMGIARGLVYLHEECRDRIIHCDIKPENILLDEDLSPKVADFGLAKLVGRDFSRVMTTTRGTRGYLAPEWISGLHITAKVDVYSFGMTLLEIISGRRNLDLNAQESSRYYFPSWAATQIHRGNLMGVVDDRISEGADVEEVRRAVMVGLLCIQEDENVRPSMARVLQILEGIVEPDAPQIYVPLEIEDSL